MRLIAAAFHALLRVASQRWLALLVYLLLIGVVLVELAALQRRPMSTPRPAAVLAGTVVPPTATPAPAIATLGTTATVMAGATATIGGTATAVPCSSVDATETATASAARKAGAAPGADAVAVCIVEPPGQDTDRWAFAPATLQVHAGTTVVWINAGRAPHTATADDGKRFDSSTLYPQAAFRFTPRQAGTITYHCTLHPWMRGTLVVQP